MEILSMICSDLILVERSKNCLKRRSSTIFRITMLVSVDLNKPIKLAKCMAYSWLAMLVEITISAPIEFCLKTIEGSLYTNVMFSNTNNKIVNKLNLYENYAHHWLVRNLGSLDNILSVKKQETYTETKQQEDQESVDKQNES